MKKLLFIVAFCIFLLTGCSKEYATRQPELNQTFIGDNCMTQIVEIKDNSFWEHDVNKAIYDFETAYGVTPHMIIGKKFIDLIIDSYDLVNYESNNPNGRIGIYKGIPCEYDPDITCVILKA